MDVGYTWVHTESNAPATIDFIMRRVIPRSKAGCDQAVRLFPKDRWAACGSQPVGALPCSKIVGPTFPDPKSVLPNRRLLYRPVPLPTDILVTVSYPIRFRHVNNKLLNGVATPYY